MYTAHNKLGYLDMGSIFLVNCICHAPTILCVTIILYCGTKCTFLALCHLLCLLGMLVKNRGVKITK